MNAAITATAIGQVPMVFLTVSPGIDRVLKVHDEAEATVVRHTRTVAAGISVFIGVCLSVVAGDATPLLFTLLTVAAMVLVLEYLTTMQDATLINGKG